ncbi:MAG: hypothetical protein KAS48_07605, partial [Gammaproteobacteria bacterium]|nr:hypothetical protein [Gammaproteobacteria bacterium]
QQMRQRLAMEAARIIAESGNQDYQSAKRKAAAHLGAPDTRNLPRNSEIEQALSEHHRLFHSESQPEKLRELRKTATEAMNMLRDFQPRLVGMVLNGTAGKHSNIELHLFADQPEQVSFFLIDRNIPFQEGDKRVKSTREEQSVYPTYRFMAGDIPVILIVFPLEGLRHPALSAVDGKPMQRANLEEVEVLLKLKY